jgi:hypothetical protein
VPARRSALLALAVLSVGVLTSGCGASVKAAPDGRWSACAAVRTPTAVTVRRHPIRFQQPPFEPVALHSTPQLARRLFDDFCVTEAHQEHPTGTFNCPEAFGLRYTGSFLAAGRTVATFDWEASGCQELALNIGGHHASTELVAAAATAAPHIDGDFRRVLGVSSVEAIFRGGLTRG